MFFSLPLIPLYIRHLYRKHISHTHGYHPACRRHNHTHLNSPSNETDESALSPLLLQHQRRSSTESPLTPAAPGPTTHSSSPSQKPLTVRETLNLALIFAPLWLLANYLNAFSYTSTTVASSTILVSTSSVFTLLFAACIAPRAEPFSWRKLLGVLASLVGVAVISLVDTGEGSSNDGGERASNGGSSAAATLSASLPSNITTTAPHNNGSIGGGGGGGGGSRGTFPYKTPAQIALGNGMALASAIIYGLYATLLTSRLGSPPESTNTTSSRVSMPLFFSFIGLIATLCYWPFLPILHWTSIEPFEPFPSRKVAVVVIANAVVSLVGDMCWAYSVLLVGPVVVTVGLSLTIPLSLVGQVVVSGTWVGWGYWVGAGVVVAGFVAVNWEGSRVEEGEKDGARDVMGGSGVEREER